MGSDGESDQASGTSSDEVQSPTGVCLRNRIHRRISMEVSVYKMPTCLCMDTGVFKGTCTQMEQIDAYLKPFFFFSLTHKSGVYYVPDTVHTHTPHEKTKQNPGPRQQKETLKENVGSWRAEGTQQPWWCRALCLGTFREGKWPLPKSPYA